LANRVIHFEIQADDLSRAKKFYETAFGWEINQMMTAEQSGMDYYGLKTGADGTPGINGGMYKRPTENQLNTYDCTLLVENVDKAITDVKNSGGQIHGEKSEIPGVGWLIAKRKIA
jgi:predicted enzyme related to lactoylglutathione lyase